MNDKSSSLTVEDRARMFVFSIDITAQQSSPARDEILTLTGKAFHDLALYESWLAQLAAVVLFHGAKNNIPRWNAGERRGSVLYDGTFSAGQPPKSTCLRPSRETGR